MLFPYRTNIVGWKNISMICISSDMLSYYSNVFIRLLLNEIIIEGIKLINLYVQNLLYVYILKKVC